jgi:putative DNA primase/helicase
MTTLDPQCEQPESRSFRRDITAHVAKHRGTLVKAALTIPLAYLAAGEPAGTAHPSRFAAWDRFVRRPLLWLGAADPLDTQVELRGADPIRGALVTVMTAWEEVFGHKPATVAQAIEAANAGHPRLLEALTEVAGERNGTINSRRLGRWLVRYLRRIETGRRFEAAEDDPITCRRCFRLISVTSVTRVSANPIVGDGSASYIEGLGANADNDGNAGECPKCMGDGCQWCRP